MENRKPQGRPERKFGRIQGRDSGSRKPSGRPVRKYEERSGEAESDKPFRRTERSDDSKTGGRNSYGVSKRPVRTNEKGPSRQNGPGRLGKDSSERKNYDRFRDTGKESSRPNHDESSGRPVRKYERNKGGEAGRPYPGRESSDRPVRKYERSNEKGSDRSFSKSVPDERPVRKFDSWKEGENRRPYTKSEPTARPVKKYEKPAERNKEVKKPTRRPSGKNKIKGGTKVTEEIRLNRYIANSGLCSRRDADEHIKNGNITVNGKQVTDLGTKINVTDDVRFKNKRLSTEKKVYILMNKPKDYVTTVEDPHADKTVLDLLGDDFPERVYPVGRLDKATTGVLLLTNDGELTGKLTHPKYKRKKIYHVFLDKPVVKNDLFRLTEGIELDGVNVIADAVSYADPEDKTQIGIELHSGQNRVIRRMFETLGYKVKKLDRVYFAGLTKKNVQRGKWRFLTDKEIGMLKRGIF